jgi:hypothetical protein
MHVLLLGASRNIGYFAALRLLAQGHTCHFLLRNPSAWDNDAQMQEHLKSGKATVTRGDALKSEDVAKVWTEATANSPVDAVVYSLGMTPGDGGSVSLTKGFLIFPLDLCTTGFRNLITTMPDISPRPRIIAVTSNGLGKKQHALLGLPFKPLYSWGLRSPHADKMGVEHILTHLTNFGWTNDLQPSPEILEEGWEKTLPSPGFLENVVIVRPAFLTDGECRADSKPNAYRTGEEVPSQYTVSRRDIGHFIAEDCLKNWEKWNGKRVTVAY